MVSREKITSTRNMCLKVWLNHTLKIRLYADCNNILSDGDTESIDMQVPKYRQFMPFGMSWCISPGF